MTVRRTAREKARHDIRVHVMYAVAYATATATIIANAILFLPAWTGASAGLFLGLTAIHLLGARHLARRMRNPFFGLAPDITVHIPGDDDGN